MVQPPAGVPAGDPAGDDEGNQVDLPGFEEADDFDLDLDVHMEEHQEVGTLIARGKHFGPHRANGLTLAEVIKQFVITLHEIAQNAKRPLEWVVPSDVDVFEFASAHIRFIVGEGGDPNGGRDLVPNRRCRQLRR